MPDRYASMILNAAPSFVEVKGYMYLGYSRKRLRREICRSMIIYEHLLKRFPDTVIIR
jgi:wyosine [tRNA(Phe)-imidazoG37] synthetase (radical SAM superfamily)